MSYKPALARLAIWIDSSIYTPHEPIMIRDLHRIIHDPECSEEEAMQAQNGLRSIREKQHVKPKIGFIYIMQGAGYCKIGYSVYPSKRLKQISPRLPFPLNITHIACAFNMCEAEQYFHDMFSEQRTNGEWFKLSREDISYLECWYGFMKVNPESLPGLVSEWKTYSARWKSQHSKVT